MTPQLWFTSDMRNSPWKLNVIVGTALRILGEFSNENGSVSLNLDYTLYKLRVTAAQRTRYSKAPAVSSRSPTAALRASCTRHDGTRATTFGVLRVKNLCTEVYVLVSYIRYVL